MNKNTPTLLNPPNLYFQPLNENLRFEALSQLREIQSNMVGISFLPVIAIMKPENPLKKDVIEFQDELDTLTLKIQEFISKAKNDLEFESPEDEIESEELDTEEDEIEDKTSKDKNKVQDSTIGDKDED